MRLPRFRLWVLMVVVALTAIGSGAWVLRERARAFQKKADHYAMKEQQIAQRIESERKDWAHGPPKELVAELTVWRRELRREQATLERLRKRATVDERSVHAAVESVQGWKALVAGAEGRLADTPASLSELEGKTSYYATLKVKYHRAAVRPWLTPQPDPPPPRGGHLVNYWFSQHEYRRAMAAFDDVLQRQPHTAALYVMKAWTLATYPDAACRDGKQAVESATRACEMIAWTVPEFIDVLAAAYAETGDFDAAIRWEREALNRLEPNSPSRQGFNARLALYQQGMPYREVPKRGTMGIAPPSPE